MNEIIIENDLPIQQCDFVKKQSFYSNAALQPQTYDSIPKSYKHLSESSISLAKKVSLLHKHPSRETLLTVFYFETDFHCTFDLSELVPTTTVSKFIEIAVEQYCVENSRFIPEGVATNTYELKLADLENKHDPLMDPIDQSDLLSIYVGNSLCLVRTEQKHSNRELYQQMLGDWEIFQVDVNMSLIREQDRILHMNHIIQMARGCTIGELMNKVISNCSIHEIAHACVLVEYQKLVRYPLSQSTATIPERKFELLKARNKFYLDEPQQIQDCVFPIETEIKIEQHMKSTSRQTTNDRLHLYPLDILNQLEGEEAMSIDVDNGIQNLLGRCSITIEKANFIQKTQESALSRLVGLVWQRQPEQVYPLAALISVSAEPQQLKLVFSIKSKAITKSYRLVNGGNCRRFVEELLRRCRLLKKKLSEWKEPK